ncbi:hypothetical protein BJ138DRAFT_634850 [Hygrophoropsis aurantiaca]|uniref:Uncharacterized protein n=1 Tax=Hygrophoropsis aurantiaca TaxID=72124 RepID=A0ACB8ALK4_9AGAM|nr:hypothetical protein BJ138DRAFT_634850 [Hygrophoropsis aurantiaca]
MASESARIAKDKGNTAFKAGDYATAVGHYTSAILADTKDPTFPLNRAAAYIKLGKHNDAERDCTTVLKLSPNNVKALFRRGQARLGLNRLDDARADLNNALKLEPANAAVAQELAHVEKTIQQKQDKQRTAPAPHTIGISSTTVLGAMEAHPKRRRIPIKIVESPGGKSLKSASPIIDLNGSNATKASDLLTPISSRSTSLTGQPPETSTLPDAPNLAATESARSFIDAKKVRESAKPPRVVGGIFRPSGQHTIITQQQNLTSVSPSDKDVHSSATTPPGGNVASSSEKSTRSVQPPVNLFQFTRSWEMLDSNESRWELISGIKPSLIPQIFQTSLEPSLLVSILYAFRHILDRGQIGESSIYADIWSYMESFQKVQRFGTVLLLMSKNEKQLFDGIWETLKAHDSSHSS